MPNKISSVAGKMCLNDKKMPPWTEKLFICSYENKVFNCVKARNKH